MRVTKNKHKAPKGFTWVIAKNWLGDKKVDCHRLYLDGTMQKYGAVKRGKGESYINWDTGEVFPNRTSAMLDVESRL